MTTRLDKSLKREIDIDGEAYTVVLDADQLRITRKGHRQGVSLAWRDLVSGDAALASALNASLASKPR